MPKKKFIDKNKSVTFHLVHRSQQDPLTADENAPQRVLLPEVKRPGLKKQIEEQQKFGVFYEDDYNYLQHLRDANKTMELLEAEKPQKKENVSKLKLPSSVFASHVEEPVGLLNKAAPSGLRLDLDPDVVAAMDDDFNYDDPDNELEDNFMELANAEDSDYEDEYTDGEDMSSNFSDEEQDDLTSLDGPQYTFKDEETKSRFTDYSMSSSVMHRNEQLTLLDDRFEKLYAGYDENEIGALDCDEIEGHVPENSDILLQYANEFEKTQQREKLDKDLIALHVMLQDMEDDIEDNDDYVNMTIKPKEKWDCESILSTYSNIYNHPKLISEPQKNKIKINPRTGVPMNVLDANKLTAKALSKLNEQNDGYSGRGPKSIGAQSIISTLSTLSIRPKGESPDERRARKMQLKEYRKERRLEKKANADAFKEEAKRQVKINLNNKNNVQGNKIL